MNDDTVKKLEFVGQARRELTQLPDPVRKQFGFALREAQNGLKPSGAKPLKHFGRGVYELIKNYDKDTYRCTIYAGKPCVYVLNAYMKKSTDGISIPKAISDQIQDRLKAAKSQEAEK